MARCECRVFSCLGAIGAPQVCYRLAPAMDDAGLNSGIGARPTGRERTVRVAALVPGSNGDDGDVNDCRCGRIDFLRSRISPSAENCICAQAHSSYLTGCEPRKCK